MELRITSRRSYTYYQQTPHGKYRIGVSDETVTVDDRDVDFMLSTGKFARLSDPVPPPSDNRNFWELNSHEMREKARDYGLQIADDLHDFVFISRYLEESMYHNPMGGEGGSHAIQGDGAMGFRGYIEPVYFLEGEIQRKYGNEDGTLQHPSEWNEHDALVFACALQLNITQNDTHEQIVSKLIDGYTKHEWASVDNHQQHEAVDTPDLDAMTKDDLMAYADEHGIEYTTRMTKAEIRAVIEEHNRGA